jgi:hypothetical protein
MGWHERSIERPRYKRIVASLAGPPEMVISITTSRDSACLRKSGNLGQMLLKLIQNFLSISEAADLGPR